jgi:hypothetical protein
MSISSLTGQHIKLSLYPVNHTLRRDFRGARSALGAIAMKGEQRTKKVVAPLLARR